jgi:hypothetical protein
MDLAKDALDDAMDYAERKLLENEESRRMFASARGRAVSVVRSDEMGDVCYAILHPDDPQWWLAHRPTREEALSKARQLGCIPKD